MAVNLKVSLKPSPKMAQAFRKMDPARNRRIFAQGAIEAALLIQANAAGVQILKGGGGIRNARPPHPTQLTSRTGRLRGDIAVDRSPLPHAIEVGTDLVYGAAHEFGVGALPKRPFMGPAFAAVRRKIPEILVRVWRREAGL